MERKAGTIVELFRQLERRGFDGDDLQLVHRAYGLTVSLCSCEYRSSGRTIIDHCVGAASILGSLGAPVPLVVAGLAHVAYLHSDFGTWRKRIDASKRARVRSEVGTAVEDYVHRYARLEWYGDAIPALARRLSRLEGRERDVVLLRLADQLDIYGGRDAVYCNNIGKRRQYARSCGPTLVAMAQDLGFPALAEALDRAFTELGDLDIAIEPRAPAWHDGIILPPSYRTRWAISLSRRLRSTAYRIVGR
jgi:(p)ppGpp synthase/HD superfamily hydrolase